MRWDQLIFGNTPLFDFDIYYQTAKDVIAGKHPFSLPYMQTGGPPSVIIPYIPFTIFTLKWARILIELLSLLSMIIAARMIVKTFLKSHTLASTVILSTFWLIAFPTRFNLEQGQPNLIIMALIALLITTKKDSITTFSSSVLALIKTNYLVIFMSLKGTKVLLTSIMYFMILIIIGFWVIKPNYYMDFVNQRLYSAVNSSAHITDVDYYNQSLKSTLARFQLSEMYTAVFWFFVLLSVIYLLITKDRLSGIVLSLLLSPILWQHYVVAVYPVIAYFLLSKQRKPSVTILVSAAMILLSIEFPWLHHQPLIFRNSLLASHYFIGLLFLLIVCINNKIGDSPRLFRSRS